MEKKCKNCKKVIIESPLEEKIKTSIGIQEEICTDCAWQGLLSFWPSIGKWYKRKCDFSGETIVTMYPENARFPIYKYKYFESDSWSPPFLSVDFSKNIFKQIKELQEKTPRPHMLGKNQENCDYCDDVWSSKNCYLSLSMLNCESIFYSYRNIDCSYCSDIIYCHFMENCHDMTLSSHCYKVFYGFNIKNSSESMFLSDCRNVKNCFMCWNLRDKEYCILNKQYTQEEYEKFIKKYNFGSRQEIEKLKKGFNEHLKENSYFTENINVSCEKSSGNFLTNCKNCENCFLLEESEDCINVIRGYKNKNSMNCSGLLEGEKCYMVNQSSYVYNLKYSSYCGNCKESSYLDNCSNCSYCFGCVGLKNKEFCILNKQYTKEEYEKTIKKIEENMRNIGIFGNFFPYTMMYSGYNTTLAIIYFPLEKEEVLGLGGYWEEDEEKEFGGEIFELLDDIKDISTDFASKAILCKKTNKPFNFSKEAIEFHQKNNIALPNISHIERMKEKYMPLSYIKPYISKCNISGKEITHYYPPSLGYKNIISKEEYEKKMY
ncbi:hypothetical protein HGA92_04415 [Candidatus Gracilibacteria bacterium]|nr:hypothetical protein [Candidatus Gracilibacteria bacterium]NUJ98522.1 hypothetical protein [Candidatus Gracilibacteria bacterium]